ncbi:MAG: WcbI family polysaccharide biosynthesis putative acetyltransferase [Rhodospirillales bacterium]
MKIGVLFNCQSRGIAESLGLLRPDDEIIHFAIPKLIRSKAARVEAGAALKACDVIVASDTHYRLGPAAPERFRAAGLPVATVPPIIFSGFHPDCCYPASRDEEGGGGQFDGPTGMMHSRIAIASFLGGLTPQEAAPLFNRLVFARLDYFARFAEQKALLLERYRNVAGIELAPLFAEWCGTGCFMHSDNHPKAFVLHDVARIACDLLALPTASSAGQPAPRDFLAHFPHHPVYPEIAAQLGVEPVPLFRLPNGARGEPLYVGLEEFLALSFAAYREVPRATLSAVEGMQATMASLGLSDGGSA